MKPNLAKIDYPNIAEQPEHKAAADKLAQFTSQLADAERGLEQLQAEHAAKFEARSRADGTAAINEADALLSGRRVDPLLEQIQRAMRDIETIKKAVRAQQDVLAGVNRELSSKAGAHFSKHHKAFVARLASAIQELHAANVAEWSLRNDLVRLGYMGGTVPAMQYEGASDPNDNTGSTAFYWMRHARGYVEVSEVA